MVDERWCWRQFRSSEFLGKLVLWRLCCLLSLLERVWQRGRRRTHSSVSTPLFVLGLPGRAAAAPVLAAVAFVASLLPVFVPGPAVFVLPVSGMGSRPRALVTRLLLPPALLAALHVWENRRRNDDETLTKSVATRLPWNTHKHWLRCLHEQFLS